VFFYNKLMFYTHNIQENIMTKLVFTPTTQVTQAEQLADLVHTGYGAPAGLVTLFKNHVEVSAASGISDLATGEKATIGQTVEVGSQTKMFTSVVVLQLIEEGKLHLNGLAKNYLPSGMLNGIANADTVTIHDLLAMRSGIPNYTDIVNGEGVPSFIAQALANPEKVFLANDALNLVRGEASGFAPNTQFEYSNTNYTILGKIIESVTGHSLEQEYNHRIFIPAGMKHTTMERSPVDADRLHGYNPDQTGQLVDATYFNWDPAAEGGAISTTHDMIKFLQALFTDRTLLNAATIIEMTKPISQIIGEATVGDVHFQGGYFGLGMLTLQLDGDTFYGFNGGTLTSLTSSYLSATTGNVVSVAGNLAQINGDDAYTPDVSAPLALAQLVKDSTWIAKTFHPASDTLFVDGVSAAEIAISTKSNTTVLSHNTVSLEIDASLSTLKTEHFSFSDHSLLVLGNGTGEKLSIVDDYRGAIKKDNHILGMGGNDTITGGSGNDVLEGGKGLDVITGGKGDDTMMGDSGDDTLKGNAGDDLLNGGAGRDLLVGGDGHDIFLFTRRTDSLETGADRIKDFNPEHDMIDVAGLDYLGIGTTMIGEGYLRLVYSEASNRTYIRDDYSSFEVALEGGDYRSTLHTSDIVLL
jgi:D-alanyl-D-alanine carboxypeptidase